MELRSRRLHLRRWRADDAADVAAAFDIYRRWEVSRWLGADPSVWPDETAARSSLQRWQAVADERPGYGLWAVVLEGHANPCGTVLLMPLRDAAQVPTGHVEVGWHFHPDAWGHGYATEASQLMIEHGWDLGLERIEAIAFADNEASIKVMERLGMTWQGETDQWYGTTFTWYRIERPGGARSAQLPAR
jgi:RimJ/RimL family protein N-acetyltransferase